MNNMHTEKKGFRSCHLERFVGRFFSDKVRKRVVHFGLLESFLYF